MNELKNDSHVFYHHSIASRDGRHRQHVPLNGPTSRMPTHVAYPQRVSASCAGYGNMDTAVPAVSGGASPRSVPCRASLYMHPSLHLYIWYANASLVIWARRELLARYSTVDLHF